MKAEEEYKKDGQEKERRKGPGREARTPTLCSDREMTSGHPEASGLSACLGKPRAHLMTPAWSVSHRFFIPDYGW